jgi:hypothetical protein
VIVLVPTKAGLRVTSAHSPAARNSTARSRLRTPAGTSRAQWRMLASLRSRVMLTTVPDRLATRPVRVRPHVAGPWTEVHRDRSISRVPGRKLVPNWSLWVLNSMADTATGTAGTCHADGRPLVQDTPEI